VAETMKRYILLTTTWLLILASIIYLWVGEGSQPSIVLWCILAILSIIPLAERLKIGNWFEFAKKINNMDKEISSARKEINRINTQLDTYFANVQQQQQFNISLLSEEAARGLADVMQPKPRAEYAIKDIVGRISITKDTGLPATEVVSSDDTERLFFVSAANETIASIMPLLQILYSTVLAKRYDKLPKGNDLFNKDILFIIEEIKNYAPNVYKFANSDKKFGELLKPMEKLISMRNDVYEKKTEVPSIEAERKGLSY